MDGHPEIVVISLHRATERRKAIEGQFAALGLPFVFFDAVDGKLGHELFSRYSAQKARRIGEIPLSPGHLGCFASHYMVWQKCVDSGKAMIVLEDDAMLYEKVFRTFFNSVQELPEYVECLRLFESKSRNRQYIPVFKTEGLGIGKFLRGHKSATGYYLTPGAAEKFVRYAETWAEPVDIEMDQFWANGVECYGLLEPCLTHNATFESAIDFGVNPSKERRGLMRLRWRWYLLKGKIRREVHNLWFRLAND
ncbi:MAG: glycosyltransferase family 25 protein [Marinobacter sp.]|uniref:glycosyltransferase family 25 protein n=1 Tax=Marinobacter sp. AC-23 TaxID=1879031 RepID=UPI0008DE6572|nr:glycosyltransferase family 25 protein [Marinobacter sp. AC-23]OHY79620.1 hypothetical protein BCA33_15650 [Marinobacter sp. AC-23]